MPEAYSPLRYPGGKAKLADFLIAIIEANDLSEVDYVEPYAGGAGAALRLLFEEYVDTIAINDVDPRIYSFWWAVTRRNDEFLSRLEKVDLSVEEWRRQRAIYKKCDKRKLLELGFATFFLNRTTRSGILHTAGPIGGHDQTGNFKIDARFNRNQLASRIQRIGIYSDRILVSGEDGLTLLKTLNRCRVRARRTFVYLDPPYYAKGPDLYLNRFSHDQHRRLADYLSRRKNFPWIMTYDNVPAVRELYMDFSRVHFSLNYSAYECRQGEELLISPDSIEVPSKAKQALPCVA